MNAIRNIAIIGSGNVADFLATRFFSRQINVVQILGRNKDTGSKLAVKVNAEFRSDYKPDDRAELILFCVPDDQISEVVMKLGNTKAMICHCAGSVGMDVLKKFENNGVLYPLQSISAKLRVDTDDLPFLIEANSAKCLNALKKLIEEVGFQSSEVDSDSRLHYHMAAVFVNNFTNAVVLAAEEIATRDALDFSLLKPLLFQTFEKLKLASPYENQTGPARRNDTITMNKHLEMLKNDPELAELYKSVTAYIKLRFKR